MEITKANKKDINQIINLLYQVHKVHSDARNDLFIPGEKKYTHEEVSKIIENENTPIYVYKENDEVIAYAFIIFKYEVSKSLVNNKIMFIDDFCVDEKHKHNGIGTKLFNHLKQLAKKENCFSINLNVYDFNTAAKNFYLKQEMNELKSYMELIVK